MLRVDRLERRGITMATVFTIAQRKGGAGKTTLALHLAVAWVGLGHRVAVVDIDPQGSLKRWADERVAHGIEGGPDVVALTGWRATGEVERLGRGHDVVVIDSPPHADTDARTAIRAATRVVVPMQPSLMDLWSTTAILEVARGERRPVTLVLNRVPARSRLADRIGAEATALGVELAQTRIGNRVALANAIMTGQGVTELERPGVAGDEIRALAEELLAGA